MLERYLSATMDRNFFETGTGSPIYLTETVGTFETESESFRPWSFHPCFRGGSVGPYWLSGFACRSFSRWIVSHIFYRGTER